MKVYKSMNVLPRKSSLDNNASQQQSPHNVNQGSESHGYRHLFEAAAESYEGSREPSGSPKERSKQNLQQ